MLGVTFDRKGRMYALESSAGGSFPTANAGRVVRLSRSGGLTPVVTGSSFPTAMTFGPDGDLYISNNGFGSLGTANGEVLKVAFDNEGDD